MKENKHKRTQIFQRKKNMKKKKTKYKQIHNLSKKYPTSNKIIKKKKKNN